MKFLFTITETAQILGYSTKTIREKIDQGELGFIQEKKHTKIHIHLNDIINYIEKNSKTKTNL